MLDGTAGLGKPIVFVKQWLWRRGYTDGSIEEAYGTGGGTGGVEIVVIKPSQAPVSTILFEEDGHA